MIGQPTTFTCKECSKKQTHVVTGSKLYQINGRDDISYIPLVCDQCDTTHYIAEDVEIVESMSEENIEKVYDEKAQKLMNDTGSYDIAREYLENNLTVLTINEGILTENEVELAKCIGAVMY